MHEKDKENLKIDVATFERMLDNHDYDPCIRTIEHTDATIDGIRALWILEHRLVEDKILPEKPSVAKFKEKYNISIHAVTLQQILRPDTEMRVSPTSRGSLNKLLKRVSNIARDGLKYQYAFSGIKFTKNWATAKKQLTNLLSRHHKMGFKYRKVKNLENNVEILIPYALYPKSMRQGSEKEHVIEFENYRTALIFMTGFINGHKLGQFREVKRWENGVLYELQKRELRKAEGEI